MEAPHRSLDGFRLFYPYTIEFRGKHLIQIKYTVKYCTKLCFLMDFVTILPLKVMI